LRFRAEARGFPFPEVPDRWLWYWSRVRGPERRENREAVRARSFPVATLLLLGFPEFFAEAGRGFAHVEPVKEGVRGLQPDAEPLRDLLFFLAFVRFHLTIVRDHFRTPFAEAG